MKYVATKAAKRMETYRVRHDSHSEQPCLLLPISFGVSSTTLLYLLDTQLKSQSERTNRTGYRLHVVHVDISTKETKSSETEALFKSLKERFPGHAYTYIPLADIYNEEHAHAVLPLEGPPLSVIYSGTSTNLAKLQRLMSTLPSASSSLDITGILKSHLLVDLAKKKGCQSIVWGHSTTRLAERTLAETAKGRGFSLPWQVLDGASSAGIPFNYPLRDLLRKELSTYSTLTDSPLTHLILSRPSSVRASASARNTTIDDLMADYFGSVEENFPSIVANVVRTSGKLKPAPAAKAQLVCALCGMNTTQESLGLHGWGGDQESNPAKYWSSEAGRPLDQLCYGCARATFGMKRVQGP